MSRKELGQLRVNGETDLKTFTDCATEFSFSRFEISIRLI